MRSVFLKLALFVLAVYLPWLGVVKFARERYFDDDFASWKLKFALADADKESFDPPHIAVGDCLILVGMLPVKIDPKLYNLGMPGATPIETYFLLKRYLANGKKPERVYLMFGFTHFQMSDVFREYTLPFGTLTLGEQLTLMNDIRIYGSSEKGNPHWLKTWGNSALTYLGMDSEIPVQVRKRFFTGFHTATEFKLELMKRTKGQHYYQDAPETILQPSPLANYDQLALNPLLSYYLRKNLDLLREAGIEAIIDFVPINTVTYQKITPRLHKEWQEFRQTLKRDYPEFTVMDMTHYPPEMFSDYDHLNQAGAEKFSEEFRLRYYQQSSPEVEPVASRN